jgi:hypothetical protein
MDISERTVARPMPKRKKPPSQSGRAFLDNHHNDLVSIDFLVVPTATFRTLFLLIVLAHQRRSRLTDSCARHASRIASSIRILTSKCRPGNHADKGCPKRKTTLADLKPVIRWLILLPYQVKPGLAPIQEMDSASGERRILLERHGNFLIVPLGNPGADAEFDRPAGVGK